MDGGRREQGNSIWHSRQEALSWAQYLTQDPTFGYIFVGVGANSYSMWQNHVVNVLLWLDFLSTWTITDRVDLLFFACRVQLSKY